jgi:hypothetical protein
MHVRRLVLVSCFVGSNAPLYAQGTLPDSVVTVTPGPEYDARPFRRAMIGEGYRDLWLTPIRVPVLDLSGLTPIDTDGGARTIALHVRRADGVEFDLRPVDPGPILTMVCGDCGNRVVSVLVSTAHPAAELVVAPLLAAAGVPHGDPRLVVIPNDPRLGPFRKEFAGVLCIVDTRATGISTDSLSRVAGRLDSRAFLRARLMDMLVGDWDRGPMHWRWQFDSLWEPIPLEHVRAFQRADGLLPAIGQKSRPELIVFNDRYPLFALMYHEWRFDRRMLQDLERPAFDSAAHLLQLALSDDVIEHAVAQMPPEFRATRGDELAEVLKIRRNHLGALADRYYRELAEGADVHAPKDSNVIEITRRPDTIEVRMHPDFDRRFVRNETHELRLYLDGVGDTVKIQGAGDGIRLRVMHNAGPPLTDALTLQRDEGSDCRFSPSLNAGSGAGSVLGLTLTCEQFGFRRIPWAYRNSIGVGYQTASGGGVFNYLGQLRPMGSSDVLSVHVVAVSSQFEWYYGEGNTVGVGTDTAFKNGLHHGEPDYRAREAYVEVTPGLTVPIGGHTTLTFSPYLRYWQTTQLGRFVDSVRPYGVGAFGTVGGIVGAELDTRDNTAYTTRGLDVEITGRGVPAFWNAVSPYGTLQGSIATYLTPHILPLHPTLALRVGGSKVWGDAPYQDLADVGGPAYAGSGFSVRGGLPERYTGQAAAYGNTQLEIPFARTRILVPVTIGLLGLNDVGRVFVPGESSSGGWHDGYGGGIFVAPSARLSTFSLTVVHSTDGTRTYFGFGTGF